MTEIRHPNPIASSGPLESSKDDSKNNSALIPSLLSSVLSMEPGDAPSAVRRAPFEGIEIPTPESLSQASQDELNKVPLLMMQIAQELQMLVVNASACESFAASERGKITLVILKRLGEYALKKQLDEETKLRQAQANQAKTRQKVSFWGFIAGVVISAVAIFTANPGVAAVGILMLAGTTSESVFTGDPKDSTTLLDQGRKGLGKLFKLMGASDNVAEKIANGVTFALLFASLVLGGAGSLSASASRIAQVIKGIVKYVGPALLAGTMSGSINDLVKLCIRVKPSGDPEKDKAEAEKQAMYYVMALTLIGVIFQVASATPLITSPAAVSSTTSTGAIAQRLNTISEGFKKLVGPDNLARLQRWSTALTIVSNSSKSAVSAYVEGWSAKTLIELGKNTAKTATINAQTDFLKKLSKLINEMVTKMTNSVDEQNAIFSVILQSANNYLNSQIEERKLVSRN